MASSNVTRDLDGKVALVTGARRGLGFEIAKGLAAAGALTVLNGRVAEPLDAAAKEIVRLGGKAVAAPFDITDEAAVTRHVEDISSAHGPIDILVNNESARDRRDVFAFALDDVRRLFDTNLVAPFHLSREVARSWRQGVSEARRAGIVVPYPGECYLVADCG